LNAIYRIEFNNHICNTIFTSSNWSNRNPLFASFLFWWCIIFMPDSINRKSYKVYPAHTDVCLSLVNTNVLCMLLTRYLTMWSLTGRIYICFESCEHSLKFPKRRSFIELDRWFLKGCYHGTILVGSDSNYQMFYIQKVMYKSILLTRYITFSMNLKSQVLLIYRTKRSTYSKSQPSQPKMAS
jgi:hypothetical protein